MFIPTDKSRERRSRRRPTWPSCSTATRAARRSPQGEAFDVSPANIDARSQRSALPDGLKVVLLPKKTRGETVNLRLSLRYGNLDNLKGFETAADFLPPLMPAAPRTSPGSRSRTNSTRTEPRSPPVATPARHLHHPDQARQSAGRARPAQADPPRADPAGRGVRRVAAPAAGGLEEQLTDPASLGVHPGAPKRLALPQGRRALRRDDRRRDRATQGRDAATKSRSCTTSSWRAGRRVGHRGRLRRRADRQAAERGPRRLEGQAVLRPHRRKSSSQRRRGASRRSRRPTRPTRCTWPA